MPMIRCQICYPPDQITNVNNNILQVNFNCLVQRVHSQCPGITTELGNTAVQVGTDTAISVEACQSATNEVFVWSKVDPSVGNERIWQSAFPGNP